MSGAIAVLVLHMIVMWMDETLLFSFHFQLYKILILFNIPTCVGMAFGFRPCGIIRLFNIRQMVKS